MLYFSVFLSFFFFLIPSNIYFLEVKNEMHIVCMLIKKSQDISLTVAKKPFQDCLW